MKTDTDLALSLRRVLLGMFIVAQLAFLAVGNAASFLRRQVESPSPELVPIGRVLADASDRWAVITGQSQNWRMFAPLVPMHATLVQTTFGKTAPDVPASFNRYRPGIDDRLWHVEKHLAWPCVIYDAEEVTQRQDEWLAYLTEHVRANAPAYRSYVNWQLHRVGRHSFDQDMSPHLGVWVAAPSWQSEPCRPVAYVPLPIEVAR